MPLCVFLTVRHHAAFEISDDPHFSVHRYVCERSVVTSGCVLPLLRTRFEPDMLRGVLHPDASMRIPRICLEDGLRRFSSTCSTTVPAQVRSPEGKQHEPILVEAPERLVKQWIRCEQWHTCMQESGFSGFNRHAG